MFRVAAFSVACLAIGLGTTHSSAQQAASQVPTHNRDRGEAPVSLQQILKLAHRAPDLVKARANIESGRAEVRAAGPLLPSDPVVSGSVGRRQTAAGSGLDFSIGLQQEIDFAGKRGATIGSARAQLRAQEAEWRAVDWFVHQRVHGTYHQALVARERARVAQRVLAFFEHVMEVARQRFAIGETSPLPVRLADAELAQARQAALVSQSQYDRIRLDLGLLVGWSKPALLTPLGTLHTPEAPPSLESLVEKAQQAQPALRAARARLLAARRHLTSAKRAAWPNVTLGVNYEQEAQPGADPARVVSGTLSFPLPVWVGSTPQRARARASVVEAEADEATLSESLATRIARAHEQVRTDAERAKLYGSEILPTLESNLDLLQKAFELGEIDILQVLIAQERFLRSQQDALQAFADYYEGWAELEAIVGAELHSAATWGDTHQ